MPNVGAAFIEHQHGAPHAADLLLDEPDQAIEHVGERAAGGDHPEHLVLGRPNRLVAAPRGDIAVGPGHADGDALRVSGHGPACEKPPDAAVAMHHAVLDLVKVGLARDMSPGVRENGGPVIGVYMPAPVVQVVANLVILVAENLFENRIDVDLAGRQIPVPDADAAGRRRALVAIVSLHGARGRRLRQSPPAT